MNFIYFDEMADFSEEDWKLVKALMEQKKERRRSLMDDRELNHEIEVLEGDLRLLANKIRALQDRLFDLKKERENRLYRIEGRNNAQSL